MTNYDKNKKVYIVSQNILQIFLRKAALNQTHLEKNDYIQRPYICEVKKCFESSLTLSN